MSKLWGAVQIWAVSNTVDRWQFRHAGRDPASSGVEYRDVSEFKAAGFRVKRGMTTISIFRNS